MIAINLKETGANRVAEFLRLVGEAPEGREVRNLVGNDVANVVRDHLYEKDKTGNRLGGRRTHYYRAAGDSVAHTVSSTGAVVGVSQVGIRQRLEGGVITPKTAKALTIPVSARAHGKRAREFPDTFILDKSTSGDPDTVGVIVQDLGGGNLDALYVLRTRVEQQPDPDVLPPTFYIMEAASSAVFRFLASLRAF